MNPMTGAFDASQQLNAFFSQAREGTKTWFRMTATMMDEADKQMAEGFKAFGNVQEHLISSRKNALTLAEETVERTTAMQQAFFENMAQAWRVK